MTNEKQKDKLSGVELDDEQLEQAAGGDLPLPYGSDEEPSHPSFPGGDDQPPELPPPAGPNFF